MIYLICILSDVASNSVYLFHLLEWNCKIIKSKSVHNENGVLKVKRCSGIDVNLPGFLKTVLFKMLYLKTVQHFLCNEVQKTNLLASISL